jgi:periplasmic protein CpxP/Spy
MRNKLFTLALGGVFALGTTAALAQDQGQAGVPAGHPSHAMRMDPDHQLANLTHELDLTTNQQTQIKPILVDRQQKLQALMENQSLSPDDRRSRAKSVMSDSNSRIEAVLNSDQKQKFEAMQQEKSKKKSGTTGSGETTSPPPSAQPQSPQQ